MNTINKQPKNWVNNDFQMWARGELKLGDSVEEMAVVEFVYEKYSMEPPANVDFAKKRILTKEAKSPVAEKTAVVENVEKTTSPSVQSFILDIKKYISKMSNNAPVTNIEIGQYQTFLFKRMKLVNNYSDEERHDCLSYMIEQFRSNEENGFDPVMITRGYNLDQQTFRLSQTDRKILEQIMHHLGSMADAADGTIVSRNKPLSDMLSKLDPTETWAPFCRSIAKIK